MQPARQRSQVLVTPLGDLAEDRAISCRLLSRHQTEPGVDRSGSSARDSNSHQGARSRKITRQINTDMANSPGFVFDLLDRSTW
jgi:hypothetical protein